MNRALLQQALYALEHAEGWLNGHVAHDEVLDTIEALRAELEKPEPEPYAWMFWKNNCHGPYQYQFHFTVKTVYPDNCKAITPVFTKEQL